MTNRFQKFAFSVNSTRSHEADTIAFSNLSTLESVLKSLRFREDGTWKRNQMFAPHLCGRGLNPNQPAWAGLEVWRTCSKRPSTKILIDFLEF